VIEIPFTRKIGKDGMKIKKPTNFIAAVLSRLPSRFCRRGDGGEVRWVLGFS